MTHAGYARTGRTDGKLLHNLKAFSALLDAATNHDEAWRGAFADTVLAIEYLAAGRRAAAGRLLAKAKSKYPHT